MHKTNPTADLSTCNGTPATLGQHNDCPDRDDTERTRDPFNDWGGAGSSNFVPALGGDDTKIAPTGDIFGQPPGGMSSVRGKLANHVGNHVVLSPEGAILVTSTGTESSYPRPPQSLNNSRPVTTPFVPPSHDFRPSFVPLEYAYAAYDASLAYISDDVVLFWHPPSVFSQWTLSPFTVDLVEYKCAE